MICFIPVCRGTIQLYPWHNTESFVYNVTVLRWIMRRWIVLLISLAMLCGCSNKKTASKQMMQYEEDYEKVLANQNWISESSCYSLSGEMSKGNDGSYNYVLVIDEARTAMYHVSLIAVENDTPYKDANKMMPSIGIFDGPFALVPNQVNSDEGYVKGMAASGQTDESSVDLKIMVSWTNEDSSKTSEEFFHVILDESGMKNA